MARNVPIPALYSLYCEISTRAHFMARAQARFPNLTSAELDTVYEAFEESRMMTDTRT